MQSPLKKLSNRQMTWMFFGLVVLLSYTTYFHRYWNPPYVFWDENYHIASAEKYLNGVYFMEQHPPLGKLLVALGEKMFNANPSETEKCLSSGNTACIADLPGSLPCASLAGTAYENCLRQADPGDNEFVNTDYGTNFKEGFSFAGYRFFSAFLSWWTAALVFAVFLILLRNPLHATLLSFLYIFDNAMIVHMRGAMLEGPLMFFSVAVVLSFLLVLRDMKNDKKFLLWSALFGLTFGLALTTKVLSLIFILLVLPIAIRLGWKGIPTLFVWTAAAYLLAGLTDLVIIKLLLLLTVLVPLIHTLYRTFGAHGSQEILRKTLIFAGGMLVPFLIVYVGVWSIHFRLGTTINSQLPDNGYYQASPAYHQALDNGTAATWGMFFTELKDSINFVSHYNNGAPRLDLCKADENGSPPFFWPLGARTINYRWQTPEGTNYSYLYLVPNPVVWWASLLALLVAMALLALPYFFPMEKPLKHRFLLATFVFMYLCYMAAVSQIDRVLYLYHYFIPLFFTFVILGLVFDEIQATGRKWLHENAKTTGLLVFAALIFVSFQFYRPLSYYEPLNNWQFNLRNIFPLWDMHCVNCSSESLLVIPSK